MLVAVKENLFSGPHLVSGIGFAHRLAYLRWLRAAGRIKPETDQEIVDWLGIGLKWLGKWKASAKPPKGRDEELRIEAVLGHEFTRWLYDGRGDPPQPQLWRFWTSQPPAPIPIEAETELEVAPTPTRRAASGRRPGK